MHSRAVSERCSPYSAPLSAGRASSPLQLVPGRARSDARRMRCGRGAPEREGSFTQRWKVSEKCSPSSVPLSVELYVATMVLLLASARAGRGFGCAHGPPSSVRACAALRSCVRQPWPCVYTHKIAYELPAHACHQGLVAGLPAPRPHHAWPPFLSTVCSTLSVLICTRRSRVSCASRGSLVGGWRSHVMVALVLALLHAALHSLHERKFTLHGVAFRGAVGCVLAIILLLLL